MPLTTYVSPFPPLKNYKFRYNSNFSFFEGAAGGGTTYWFTPSSLYDPDNSGIGHQPMFFDQLCSSNGPYTQYRAFHTDLEFQFNSISTSPSTIVVFVATSANSPVSFTQAMEKPWKVMKQLAPAGSAPTIQTIRMRVPHAAAMGVTEQHIRNDDYYAGTYNSSPSKNVFIGITLWGQGATIASTSVVVGLNITAQLFAIAPTTTS